MGGFGNVDLGFPLTESITDSPYDPIHQNRSTPSTWPHRTCCFGRCMHRVRRSLTLRRQGKICLIESERTCNNSPRSDTLICPCFVSSSPKCMIHNLSNSSVDNLNLRISCSTRDLKPPGMRIVKSKSGESGSNLSPIAIRGRQRPQLMGSVFGLMWLDRHGRETERESRLTPYRWWRGNDACHRCDRDSWSTSFN